MAVGDFVTYSGKQQERLRLFLRLQAALSILYWRITLPIA